MALPTPDHERRLIEHLQPVRQYFLASTLHHALQTGVFAALADNSHSDEETLAARLESDERRLRAVLNYLQNENYVVSDGGWWLTTRGAAVREFEPWYQMLASWIVVEMDHRPTSPLLGTHGPAQAFHNPYFLIHDITEQRLETRGWWIALFETAGLNATDPRVDSIAWRSGPVDQTLTGGAHGGGGSACRM